MTFLMHVLANRQEKHLKHGNSPIPATGTPPPEKQNYGTPSPFDNTLKVKPVYNAMQELLVQKVQRNKIKHLTR
ncbi:hypothetical protein P9H32_10970 [Pontiella sp. NLcol2]|uniref:Uncharacterized protein n=1 Tax=Pontiella agarivorans TaxID=3038953 RepID=A0ABU5MY93_9BACT|nr:hypothetical protein [Pontiella agarivorans]